jgi:hypothetical protein
MRFEATATTELIETQPVVSNVPGVTLESLSTLNEEIPEGCFEGIGDLCEPNASNVTFCSDSAVSDFLVKQELDRASDSLSKSLFIKDTSSSTSVTHTSTCEGNQEIGWIETYEISSTKSREPNTTYEAAVILVTPFFSAVSLLQVRINSFGTSSIQYACQIMNGEALEFSSIVGGIVEGYTISESQYDCTRFVAVPYNELAGNYTSSERLTQEKEFYDLPDKVGLALEYTIVCIYIVLSYFAAFKAYQLHMQQSTRTDFKTRINLSFVILFLVWASGNLFYLIVFSAALTDTNFFYIKSVLTLTYFSTYLGFTLIVHYRYRLTFSLF